MQIGTRELIISGFVIAVLLIGFVIILTRANRRRSAPG